MLAWLHPVAATGQRAVEHRVSEIGPVPLPAPGLYRVRCKPVKEAMAAAATQVADGLLEHVRATLKASSADIGEHCAAMATEVRGALCLLTRSTAMHLIVPAGTRDLWLRQPLAGFAPLVLPLLPFHTRPALCSRHVPHPHVPHPHVPHPHVPTPLAQLAKPCSSVADVLSLKKLIGRVTQDVEKLRERLAGDKHRLEFLHEHR
jgi:hypothetical protein